MAQSRSVNMWQNLIRKKFLLPAARYVSPAVHPSVSCKMSWRDTGLCGRRGRTLRVGAEDGSNLPEDLAFFDGAISLPQCSELITQHISNSGSHVRAAMQEFGRTDAPQQITFTRWTLKFSIAARFIGSRPCKRNAKKLGLLNTIAQLTEGRSPGINPSSRQQKKQRTKKLDEDNTAHLLCSAFFSCIAGRVRDIVGQLLEF